MILGIKCDQRLAQVYLCDDDGVVDDIAWQAHRELAATLHLRIKKLLDNNKKTLSEIEAIVFYKGPGSFTGLRIGLAVANTLANELDVPIVSETGIDWLEKSIKRLKKGENEIIAKPFYGSEPHITKPKR